jgi:hypothetical protein
VKCTLDPTGTSYCFVAGVTFPLATAAEIVTTDADGDGLEAAGLDAGALEAGALDAGADEESVVAGADDATGDEDVVDELVLAQPTSTGLSVSRPAATRVLAFMSFPFIDMT